MYKLKKLSGKARLGELTTVSGTVQTPLFMNVATCGAIKGGLSAFDLSAIDCQIELCNTYHLHLRPGDEIVKGMGGLSGFMNCKMPTLTDSGGFQVFSLSKLRKISEDGVQFSSHIDGRRLFIGPKESMRIQSNLASTIAMAFDECIENPCEYTYAQESALRTVRWLERCKAEMDRLNNMDDTLNKKQMLFGINQGSIYSDIRIDNMKRIRDMDLDGYAVGGLAVGETAEEMYEVIETVEPYMPSDKIRYLMGVGTPINIVEAVDRGIDFFDCVMPSRNARHGTLFTSTGMLNILNAKYESDTAPIDSDCGCHTCTSFSRGYMRHLFKAREVLGLRLAVIHNLYYYNNLMKRIRESILNDTFTKLKNELINIYK